MRIDDAEGRIIFDHLVNVGRDLGSDEPLSVLQPVRKAAAENVMGGFADRDIREIHSRAREAASNLRTQLTN